MPETRKYTVVDLFAGVGGLSYGFSRNEHYEIILANEMQKDIAKAYTLNHPSVNMLQGDIKDLSEDVLRQTIGNRTVDVVVGGPPCQSYSTLGKRQMDARANLFMEYKRVLCILHPRAFLFENVKGILSMDKGALFEHVRKEFEDIGYSLQYKILNAVDYGVPQLRERVILVGFLGENPFQYPEPTHGEGLLPYVTLHDALKDTPALSCGEKNIVYAAPPDNEFLSWVRQGDSIRSRSIKLQTTAPIFAKLWRRSKTGRAKMICRKNSDPRVDSRTPTRNSGGRSPPLLSHVTLPVRPHRDASIREIRGHSRYEKEHGYRVSRTTISSTARIA